ncbi:aldo/keto reductase [Nesterenkonia sedimenti]|nr:aldo/keto reductase [Nesterenkonia sedimenti]
MGFGTAPLGNMFRDIPEDEALATVQAAWDHGIRYFDTAPFYGAGLAEERLGEVLSKQNRDDFVLSTKVGRLVEDEYEEKSGLFEYGHQKKITTDFSAEATERSIEESLKRLKTDRLDFVFIHDTSRDFYGDEWISLFDQARNGAFKVLNKLKEEGVISGWGLGVNTTEPIELALDMEADTPTISLSATQYSLLKHEKALQRIMPKSQAQGAQIVVGGPFNSGALLGGNHFDYAEIPPEVAKQVETLNGIADRHGVSLKAAAMQFSTAHQLIPKRLFYSVARRTGNRSKSAQSLALRGHRLLFEDPTDGAMSQFGDFCTGVEARVR